MPDPTSSSPPNGFINMALSDERVQSLPKNRPTKRIQPNKARNNSTNEVEAEKTTSSPKKSSTRSSDPTPSSPYRTTTGMRSLSPRKLGRNLSGSLTPMLLTPVMKGFKMLSRNVVLRHSSPMRASESDSDADGLDAIFKTTTTPQPTGPRRLSECIDVKTLMPPSGRFDISPPGDDDDDDGNDDDQDVDDGDGDDDPQARSNIQKPSSSRSSTDSEKPNSSSSSSSNNIIKKPSSASSSHSSSKPLSWSSSCSNQKPPSSSSVSSGEKPNSNRSSNSSSNNHNPKKPTSSSSSGSSSVDPRRRVPRPPQRKSEEISSKTMEGATTTAAAAVSETSRRARRTRSSTPRRQLMDDDEIREKSQQRPEEPANLDTSPIRRRASSNTSQSRRKGILRPPPHDPSDETSHPATRKGAAAAAAAAVLTTDDTTTSRPRRARSATPRRQPLDDNGIKREPSVNVAAANEDEAMAAITDTLLIRRRSSSQKSGSNSRRQRRSISQEPNPEARNEPSIPKNACHNKLVVVRRSGRSKSPGDRGTTASAVFESVDTDQESKISTMHDEREKESRVQNRQEKGAAMKVVKESDAVIARNERKEKARRARSKSGDRTSSVVNHPSKTPRRTRSASFDNSKIVPTEEQASSKPTRRGRKPNLGESVTTVATVDNPDKTSTNRGTGHQRRLPQEGQHLVHEASLTLEEALGGLDLDRPTLVESFQRKNIDKEALENVKSLKDDLKEMRMQQRQARFRPNVGARQGESESADNHVVLKSAGSPVLQQDLQETKSQQPTKYWGSETRSRTSGSQGAANQASLNTSVLLSSGSTGKSDFNTSKSTTFTSKSELNTSKSLLHSSMTDLPPNDSSTSKLMHEFNSSYISIQDLDIGYLKAPTPVVSEHEIEVNALLKKIKKTKKLIKRATRDVWTEREEIIHLQRTNWSIRKALMQIEGPPDSLTTLNMKIEKLLRQERELDLESDRMREANESLEEECAKKTQSISRFRDLHEQLNRTIVPLLPVPEIAPDEVRSSKYLGAEPISPLPSPMEGMRGAFTSSTSESPLMADSLHSTDDHVMVVNNEPEQENEASISLSHLRLAMLS